KSGLARRKEAESLTAPQGVLNRGARQLGRWRFYVRCFIRFAGVRGPGLFRNKVMMPPKIAFDTAELACFHEAGHAAAAIACGARVTEMVLYREQPRSYGRTR